MSDADVGVFNAALRTSLLLGLFLISINSIVAPRFAALYQRDDLPGLERTARWSTMLLTGLSLPVCALFLVLPAWVMSWFGDEFVTAGKNVLLILTLGQIVNVMTGPVNYLLMMTGHEKDMRRVALVSFLICGVSIWPCVALWGLNGAALSVAASMATMNLLSSAYVRKRLGFFTFPFLPTQWNEVR